MVILVEGPRNGEVSEEAKGEVFAGCCLQAKNSGEIIEKGHIQHYYASLEAIRCSSVRSLRIGQGYT